MRASDRLSQEDQREESALRRCEAAVRHPLEICRCRAKLIRLLLAGGALIAAVSATMTDEGLPATQTVERMTDDQAPSFSPTDSTIIFHRSFSTQRRGVDTHPIVQRSVLILMRANGTRKRAVRPTLARFDHSASFSRDGRSILFVRKERIYVMQRDGTRVRVVRRDALAQACPRFSPDDRKISLWRGSAESGAYYVMNADGTELRRISGRQRFAWGCPSWFPDGNRLVFTSDFSLYVARSDGTQAQRITNSQDGILYRPAVSPDGRWIAADGWHRQSGYGIVVMRADGSRIRRITRSADEIRHDSAPSWSLNGQRIAFSGYRGGLRGAGIYVVRRDGTGLRRLSNFTR